MGPQPLSRVKRNASTLFDPEALLKGPELAKYPMTVIARWGSIDRFLAELLVVMLRSTDLAVGMAMFQALTSGEARRAALLAAGAEALNPGSDDHCLFQAVLNVIAPSRNRRNDFAHHLWGISSDLPNALLLVDPKIWVKQSTLAEVYERALSDPNPRWFFNALTQMPPTRFIDHKNVQVFRERDFLEDVKAAQEADAYVLLLNFALDRQRFGDAKADQVRSTLLSAPRVRQEFQRLTTESARAGLPRPRLRTRRRKQ
jgi:hypothetical protein